MTGPLAGYRVLELGGIGPGPFAAMLLSDLGAEVLRIDRTTDVGVEVDPHNAGVLLRGRRSVALDLKQPHGKDAFLSLVERHGATLRVSPCGRGGIGRHARFRFWWRKPCRFKSCRPHHAAPQRQAASGEPCGAGA